MKTYKLEITEEFIKEAHAVACSEWKTKIENLVPEAFRPEVDKWYKKDGRVFFITEFDEEGHAHGYGIDSTNKWLDVRDVNLDLCMCHKNFVKTLIPATKEEVEEMLTKEAKKRGLVEGCSFKSPWVYRDNNLVTSDETREFNMEYYQKELIIETSSQVFTIFKDGEWAEPIQNKTSQRLKEVSDFGDRIGSGFNRILKRIEALETELEKLKSEL